MSALLIKVASTATVLGTLTASGVGGWYSFKGSDSVKNYLNNQSDNFLSFESTDGTNHMDGWEDKVNEYRQQDNKQKIPGVELFLSIGEVTSEEINKLKAGCSRLLDFEGNETNISIFKKWCMKEKGED